MKIGIWMEIPPAASWKYEGLTRLVRFVLSGMEPDSKETFTLVFPSWVPREEIDEFLKPLSAEQRTRISARHAPSATNFIVARYAKMTIRARDHQRRQYKKGRRQKLSGLRRYQMATDFFVARLSALRANPVGVFLLFLLLVMGMIGGLAAALLAAPVLLLGGLLVGILTLVRALGIGQGSGKELFKSAIKQTLAPLRRINQYIFSPYFLMKLIDFELKYMARRTGKKIKVDCWYVPHIGYKSGCELPAPKVFLFPDYVVSEYTSGFTADDLVTIRKTVAKCVRAADHLITISNHVAERHIKGTMGVTEDKITVINHGFVDISEQLEHIIDRTQIGPGHSLPKITKTPESLLACEKLIKQHIQGLRRKDKTNYASVYRDTILPYLLKMDLTKTKYIIISTQNRPYKNTLGVIKAVEIYNKRAKAPVRILMTGDYRLDHPGESTIGDYIRKNGLWFDVISLPRVPDKVHAAMYHAASLAIHASFFEGGAGNFVFPEAASLGTPTIMSRSLAHDEGYGDYPLYQDISFDPSSHEKMADMIETALQDPEGLYQKQYLMADEILSKRDWRAAYKDYVAIMRTAAENAKT